MKKLWKLSKDNDIAELFELAKSSDAKFVKAVALTDLKKGQFIQYGTEADYKEFQKTQLPMWQKFYDKIKSL